MIALYGHPFSSYTWKALIALYESETPFDFRDISGTDHSENEATFLAYWPVGKFPLLVEDGTPVMESSVIAEYVAPDLVPANAAREVRMLDRIFDNHVMTPAQQVVVAAWKNGRHSADVDHARSLSEPALDKIYSWLDARLAGRSWAAGETFSLADCAGAASLFYADWVYEIPASLKTLRAYRAHVLARPAVARVVDEARPYRNLFPLGAPDRD